MIPESPFGRLREPPFAAMVGDALTVLAITGARIAGLPVRIERALLALFLASMPLVYVAGWFRAGGGGRAALVVEFAGLVLFAGAALLGATRAAAALAAGIVGHGLFWDLWHYGHSALLPGWYAIACAIADLGVGCYAALRVRALSGALAHGAGTYTPTT